MGLLTLLFNEDITKEILQNSQKKHFKYKKPKKTLFGLDPWKKLTKFAARKMKFSIIDFFRKCNQICSFLIWSHFLKKSLMENLIFLQWFARCKLFNRNNFLVSKLYVNFISSTFPHLPTLNKNKFPLRISAVKGTKFGVSYGFGHIYWRNP